MKKLILLLAFGCLTKAKAQTYVNIPDANFRAYLQTIVPSAMSGTSLNITSTLVTSGTQTINVNNSSISNLSGVQYFTSLTYLYCNNNSLPSLPVLPNSLQYLDCGGNSIISLPTLPNSLQMLYCDYNSLTALPPLANSLQTLSCSNNSITNLPSLPNSLTYIHCGNNSLNGLPILSSSLQRLDCYFNTLTTLPILPNSLQILACGYNTLNSLPSLPISLQELSCESNFLTGLPTLPNSLKNLYCQNNNISCFPTFPSSLTVVNISPNPYNCLPNIVLPAMNIYATTPLCTPGNTNGCVVVTGFEEFSANKIQLKLYPNPTKEMLTIELDPLTPLKVTDYKIEIQNTLGQVVYQPNHASTPLSVSINIQHLPAGMYFVNLLQDDKLVSNKKIIKE